MELSYHSLAGRWLLFLWLLAGPAAWAQAPAPAWQSLLTFSQNDGSLSEVIALATNASGDTYLAGYYTGTAHFGDNTFTHANTEGFLAKLDHATNSFAWVQQFDTDAGGYPPGADSYCLAVDGTTIYLSGQFRKELPGAPAGTTPLSSPGVFVLRLTDTGTKATLNWAQPVVFGDGPLLAPVLTSSSNGVYLTGSFFSAAITIGASTLTNSATRNPATNSITADFYVAKLTDAGTSARVAWAQRYGSAGNDYGAAVAVSGATVYVTGFFESPTLPLGSVVLTNADAQAKTSDVFVAKLTDEGPTAAVDWAQRAGGAYNDIANALAVSGNSLYLTGTFIGPAAGFGSTLLATADSPGTIANDLFVAKLTDAGSSGSFGWAVRAGSGDGNDFGKQLLTSGTSVYVAGTFGGRTADFGSTTLTGKDPNGLDQTFFVAKVLDGSTGSFAWATSGGGGSANQLCGLALTGTNLTIAGSIHPPASFGALLIPNSGTKTPDINYPVGFVATLAASPLLATAAAQPAAPTPYPNPAHGRVTVALPAGAAMLQLLDALGRVVRTVAAPASPYNLTAELDLSGVVPGVYALRPVGGGAPTSRLVVN